MGRIAVISASIGAGHDSAAQELARRLRAAGYAVDCYDFLEMLPFGLGRALRAVYRQQLACAPASWEWLLKVLARWSAAHALVIWLSCLAGPRMRRVLGSDAVLALSTYPLASQVLARLRRQARLRVPAVTYLTDPSVHPLWIASGTDRYLAAHPETADQVRRLGEDRVTVVAPAVRPEFRPPRSSGERAVERFRWGLPPERRLAAVLSGSWAVGEIETTAREIAATGAVVPVVVCGRNDDLHERLADLRPGVAFGWVEDMPSLLRACDLAVLNSGGLGFLEAHASGLPVVSYRCLAGHGRTNAAALEVAGLARWVRTPQELPEALLAATPGYGDSPADGVGEIDPAVPIAALAGPPPVTREAPRKIVMGWRRRLATWSVVVICLLWMVTNGTSHAAGQSLHTVLQDSDLPSSGWVAFRPR